LVINDSGGSGQNTLTVRAGGNGTVAAPPQFEVFADGVSLGVRSITAPLEQSGGFNVTNDALFQDYVFNFAGASPSNVTIVYSNDGTSTGGINRDLVVDYIDLNGSVFESEVAGFFTPNNGNTALGGAREKLFVNGQLVFDNLPDTGGGGGNNPPTIDPIANITVTEGETASFTVNADDLDGETPSLSVAVTVNGSGAPVSPSQYSFTDNGNGTGSFNWITDDMDSGSYSVVVTADDGTDQTTENLLLTINDTGGPTLIQNVFLVNTQTDITLVEMVPGGTYQFTLAELNVMGIYTETPDGSPLEGQIGSVVLSLDGSIMKTENAAPYSLFGDSNGNFRPGSISDGEHTLTTDVYSGTGGNGTLLDSQSFTFELVDSLLFG
jgi:hypothetical protein